MSRPTCAGCAFWRPREPHDGAPQGECRRHAPEPGRREPAGSETTWPVTGREDWCGDFEARGAGEAGQSERIDAGVGVLVREGNEATGREDYVGSYICDQALRALLGNEYAAWRAAYEDGGAYEWSEGIAP